MNLHDEVHRMKLNIITVTLAETNGNMTRAAKCIGWTKRGLRLFIEANPSLHKYKGKDNTKKLTSG